MKQVYGVNRVCHQTLVREVGHSGGKGSKASLLPHWEPSSPSDEGPPQMSLVETKAEWPGL